MYAAQEKDIKCATGITAGKKRTRTKSESRGISEENSPTRSNVDNEKIVNLLKGNRRPLEVDAREFRVLKEKLLREQHQLPNLKRESKKFKSDFQESVSNGKPKSVECELKFSDKINGRVHQSVDDEVFWKEPTAGPGHLAAASSDNHQKEIDLNPPGARVIDDDIRVKPNRKSRREHFEIEVKDYNCKPFSETDLSDVKQRRNTETKSSLEKHVSSKEVETKQRESLPHHYTREEKEWLKEKLLQEFERQELAMTKEQVQGECSGKEGVLANSSAAKETPINLLTSVSSDSRHKHSHSSHHKPNGAANGKHLILLKSIGVQLSCSGHAHGQPDDIIISPPCTCGANDESPDRKRKHNGHVGHDTCGPSLRYSQVRRAHN